MNLPQLAQAVVKELAPIATADNAPKRATLTSAIMTAFRPYVELAISGTPGKLLRDTSDRREKHWRVSLEFWRAKDGEFTELAGESEGRNINAGVVGGEVVKGLDDAAALIDEYAQTLGAPLESFGFLRMTKALANLRPTLSRQSGRATMRRTSDCQRWHLVCDIIREAAE
jgi:hypothetical protein